MGLTSSSHRKTPEPFSVDKLTDDEIYALICARSKETAVGQLSGPFPGSSAWKIGPDAVAKFSWSATEAFMMTYVSAHTAIRIPKVLRAIPARAEDSYRDGTWIVMEHIDGEDLEVAWPTMSWWRRICVLWTARRYIRQLQRVPLLTRDVPGPFDAAGRPYLCRGTFFREDGAGPFQSYAEMAAWFDRRRFDCLAAYHNETGGEMTTCPKFDASHPLVLCHMDLHLRNFLVDKKGGLWLIDWANAGAYPAWLEYAQLAEWGDAAREDFRPPKLWIWFAPFMIGNYRRYKTMYLDKMRWAWCRPSCDFYDLDYFDKLGLEID
ncbi:hypothetical protein PC9H_011278 [Pleurotus ostreatus]|uniref:Aminoglycoside phosphotransferase domain-containing protein n=1 Tax=Pleurotus ostreatus TaxID=5322 RepID=A0A8H7DLB0_PLEOS|nr:uncharacterized protein PC9H_011278 [Pleurotus ostreatus]KAF7420760.1 hypothetical protein PC9H_011278 [Pleurotus ostreatus]KAJ8690152.1 hypothetical protein PTI98_011610 [Pleurotus ostreatus]